MHVRPRAEQRWHKIAPKVRVVKNVVSLTVACACAYGACVQPLETYVSVSAVGCAAMSLLYLVGSLSCLYGNVLAARLSFKITLILCVLTVSVLLLSVVHIHYMTLMLASACVGLALGPLVGATHVYLLNMAAQYAYFSKKTQMHLINRFVSVLDSFNALGFSIGHLLIAGAFDNIESAHNTTETTSKHQFDTTSRCGRWFCNKDVSWPIPSFNLLNLTSLLSSVPSMSQIVPVYSLSISAGLCLSAIAVLLPMGRLTIQYGVQTPNSTRFGEHVSQMMALWQHKSLRLMLPAVVCCGLGHAFLVCDIMRAFVWCMAERSSLGYVLFAAGGVSSFLHLFLCSMVRHISRLTILLTASAILFGSLAVMWMWRPVVDDRPMLYVITCSTAMSLTIIRGLCQGMLCKLFPTSLNAPYSLFFLHYFAGISVGFAMCPCGCFVHKLYIYGILYAVSLCLYARLELIMSHHPSHQQLH